MKTTYEPNEIKWDIAYLKTANVKFFIFSILFFCTFFSISNAQDLPNEIWHPGMIVLDSEDTLRGKIQYNFETNLIQFSEDKRIRTFTSQNVLYLSFHCQYFKRFRYVYSLPYKMKGRMNVPTFFEILNEGKITLMAREYVIVESSNRFGNPMYRSGRGFGNREILTYDYFLLTDDGTIHKYTEKKKDLFAFFGRYEEPVKEFIKDSKLKVDRQADLVRIIDYYNELAASN
jgi:hypothetical protein